MSTVQSLYNALIGHRHHRVLIINMQVQEHLPVVGLEVIKLFPCSTQLSMKIILLINVKMRTKCWHFNISMINTKSERLKARNFFICRYFSFFLSS